MTLSLVELYDCAACVDGAEETDIHGAHQESQKQHHVQITWGTQFRPGFRIEIEGQTSGFPLLDEDQIVVQSAIGYLTTLLQRWRSRGVALGSHRPAHSPPCGV